MADDLRALWLRVVAGARRDIERLRRERPDLDLEQDLDDLLRDQWSAARQATIEDLAREEAGGDETIYLEACLRLDRGLPREYPYLP